MTTTSDTYLTIRNPATGLFKDKGSKFLGFAFPVSNEKEVKTKVDLLRKEYFDARHHCYAYRLGPNKELFRANDDGEPSGTAGKPILGQIVSKDLTNILIVVVRYFGGTLLGTSGLINAYRKASIETITNASIIQEYVYAVYDLEFDYLHLNQVMKMAKDFEAEIFDQQFEMICRMKIKIKAGNTNALLAKLNLIDQLKINTIESE